MRFLSTLGAISTLTLSAVGSKVPIYMYVDVWDQSPDDISAEFIRMAEAGVSHIIMAFHLEGNALFPDNMADTVAIWNDLAESERASIIEELHKRGTKVLVSSGGETEGTYWLNQDATAYGTRLCQLVKGLGVDGVDFDKEGFGWVSKQILDWNVAATIACRKTWPDAIITSAPQSPHVSNNAQYNWADGLNQGAAHDHYLIQYYNQGTWTQDTTYQGLFSGSGVGAINELKAKYGSVAKADQFVVGKPFLPSHAGSGFVELTALREMMCKAWTEQGYRGGLMFWKHPWGQDLSSITMLSEPCDNAADDETTSAPQIATTSQIVTPTPTTPTPTSTTTTLSTTTTTTTTPFPTPLPTAAPATTQAIPSTIPTSAQTSSSAAGGVVSECEDQITAISGYGQFLATCKNFCTQYASDGPLAAWCPSSATADDLMKCVTNQQPYCKAPEPAPTSAPGSDSQASAAETTTAASTGDVVADCESRITATPIYAHFSEHCKEFCAQYYSTGPLSPWCPSSDTVEELIQCVTSQQVYCTTA